MSDSLIFFFPNRMTDSQTIISLASVSNGDIVEEFNEGEAVEVSSDSQDYIVSLECPSYLVKGRLIVPKDNLLLLSPGVSYRISDGGNEDLGYLPDVYKITIESHKGFSTDVYFKVRCNSQVPEEGLENISKKLEGIYQGLSLDLLSFTSKGGSEIGPDNELSPILYLESTKADFQKHCRLMTSHLAYDTLPLIRKETLEKKQNLKTIRMKLTHACPDSYYNIKKVFSYNIKDNSSLKHYLLRIKIVFNKIAHYLGTYLTKINSNMKQITSDISTESIVPGYSSLIAKRRAENHLKNLNSKLTYLTRLRNQIELWRRDLQENQSCLMSLLESPELVAVEISSVVSFSAATINNPWYCYFKDYQEGLHKGFQKGNETHTLSFATKRSFLLFELYGFSLIKDALEYLGYQEDSTTVNSILDFTQDSYFLFKKQGKAVGVLYNHYCLSYDSPELSQPVTINSNSNTPDYLLSFYADAKNPDPDYLAAVEMKYRREEKLYRPGTTTESESTLADYIQLGYKNSQGKIARGVVKKAIILFPSLKEDIIRQDDLDSLMIGINISKDEKDSLGFASLVQEIGKLA
jgi:hypothetical protein